MRRSVLLGLAPVTLALTLCASPSRADYPMDVSSTAITGTVEESAMALDGVYGGGGLLTLALPDQESNLIPRDVSVSIRSEVIAATVLEDGTIALTRLSEMSFGAEDSILTLDEELLTPFACGDCYLVSTTMTIIGGTGAGRSAGGRLDGTGWRFTVGGSVQCALTITGIVFFQ